MYDNSLQIIILLWNLDLIDAFSAITLITNLGVQWAKIVGSKLVDGTPGSIREATNLLLEPINGFGVSFRFIKSAPTLA